MSAARGGEAITLSGPPSNTSGVAPLDSGGRAIVAITLELAAGPAIYRASVRPLGHGTSEIRLRLPADTPPGTYNGEGPFGGGPRDIVVEVEPVLRLRIHPRRTSLAAEAGARSEFEITLVNSGNVPFDVPKQSMLDLDDAEGQDRALGRALRAELPVGERRVDRFFEELRADHGGEARVAVASGGVRLEPGEASELTCRLELPLTVQEGRSYFGAWQLGNASHLINVDITKGRGPSIRRRPG
ncbi:MAG: hypothetical protein ACREL7_09940 [Longimicrobiales bacterium]